MRPQAIALLLALSPTPALATGSIACSSSDGQASVQLTIGSLPVLKVVRASISAGGQEWHTDGSGEEALAVGQTFQDDETIRVDFTDTNIERVIVELRLFYAAESNTAAMAGILRIADEGAWALDCVGP